MLVEFRCEATYLCFRDERVLSMVASADDTLPDNVIEPSEDSVSRLRLLRSAVVYGANASGKTKLLDALAFVQRFVSTSANIVEDDASRPIPVMPFMLDSDSPSQAQPLRSDIHSRWDSLSIRFYRGSTSGLRRVSVLRAQRAHGDAV